MPVKGKKTLTVAEDTHYEIGLAAKQARMKSWLFVNEVWEFWKRKGGAPPAAAKPAKEAGFDYVKVPADQAEDFRALVRAFSGNAKAARELVTAWETLRKSTIQK